MGKCTDTQFLPGGASGSGSGSRGSSARWRIWGSGRRDGGIWLCWTVGLLNSELWISSWISSCEFLLNWGESKQYLYDVHDISSFYIYIYIKTCLLWELLVPQRSNEQGWKQNGRTDGWIQIFCSRSCAKRSSHAFALLKLATRKSRKSSHHTVNKLWIFGSVCFPFRTWSKETKLKRCITSGFGDVNTEMNSWTYRCYVRARNTADTRHVGC